MSTTSEPRQSDGRPSMDEQPDRRQASAGHGDEAQLLPGRLSRQSNSYPYLYASIAVLACGLLGCGAMSGILVHSGHRSHGRPTEPLQRFPSL